MTPPPSPAEDPPRQFRCVDDYLVGLLESLALDVALRSGIIDQLVAEGEVDLDALAGVLENPHARVDLLVDVLISAGVLERSGDGVALTPAFTEALDFRDLLEAKLDFGLLAGRDLLPGMRQFIADSGAFAATSATYELYGYESARQVDEGSDAHTRRWMAYVTALTRYEAPILLAHHDFSGYGTVVELGGNSGELAVQLTRAVPQLEVEVLDLPGVCQVGRHHVEAAGADRVTFTDTDLLTTTPADLDGRRADVVLLKSVLHDWPEPTAVRLLELAWAAAAPGGRIVVFERGPLRFDRSPIPLADWGLFICAPAFRPPDLYVRTLNTLGATDVEVATVPVDFDFVLVAATKPAAPDDQNTP